MKVNVCPSGMFCVTYISILAHCQPHRGFYNNNTLLKSEREFVVNFGSDIKVTGELQLGEGVVNISFLSILKCGLHWKKIVPTA